MKILLIADVHNRPLSSEESRERTLDGLERAIKENPCDLIVFLGDTVHGPDFKKSNDDYGKYLRQVLDLTGDIPFASVFGNHDDECKIEKDEILNIISEYPNSITNGRNYTVDMMGEKLLFVDSGSYYNGKGSYYDTVKEHTIEWAKAEIEGSKAILFQHIIVPDIFDVIKQYKLFIPFLAHGDGKSVKFKKGVSYTGKMRERPCPPKINTGELDALATHLKGAVFGHDHVNDFELELKGVKLIQCAGAGYQSYDKKLTSSVKILDTVTMETRQVFY